MKRMLVALLLGFALVSPSIQAADAIGSAFGCLNTAESIGQGRGDLNFSVGLADATSFVGFFRYGLSKYTDGRIKLGLVDSDGSDAKFTIGADFNWQFITVNADSNHTVDLSTGGLMEFVDFDGASVFQIGGHMTGSIPIRLKGGGKLSPYARINARLEQISLDLPPNASGDDSETSLKLGFNGGVKWRMNSELSLLAEFQLDGNDGLFLGIDYRVM
ncbi:MAG: hypothetical protein KKA42_04885 [candidate division Zixibacteria bacterium]|nr:hypothetical protein [candidate division Zixibacteria bacterium]